MISRFSLGLALGAVLGTSAMGLAQTPPAPTPQGAAKPVAPPATAVTPGDDKGKTEDKAETKAKPDDRAKADIKAKADNKAMNAYKAYFDAKLAGLHAGLELTPAQAPLWAPVETAIRDLAKTHVMIHRTDDADGKPADPLHQLQQTSDRLIRGGQAMKALAEATGPLLASLDEDQKDRLPRLLEGLRPERILLKAFNVQLDRRSEGDDDREGSMRGHGRVDGDREADRDRDDEGYEPRHRPRRDWDRGSADRSEGPMSRERSERDPERDGYGERRERDADRFERGRRDDRPHRHQDDADERT